MLDVHTGMVWLNSAVQINTLLTVAARTCIKRGVEQFCQCPSAIMQMLSLTLASLAFT